MTLVQRLDAMMRESAAGRSWIPRAALVVWMAWLASRYWNDRAYLSIWHGINLAFHEAGHIVFAPLGRMPGVMGGTLMELIIPLVAGALLFRQRDLFGVAVAVGWLGIVCFETATYAGDALALALPLVSPFGAPGAAGHDWGNILAHFNALRHTYAVAAAWESAGRLFMTAGLVFGSRMLWLMARSPGAADPELTEEGTRFLASYGLNEEQQT